MSPIYSCLPNILLKPRYFFITPDPPILYLYLDVKKASHIYIILNSIFLISTPFPKSYYNPSYLHNYWCQLFTYRSSKQKPSGGAPVKSESHACPCGEKQILFKNQLFNNVVFEFLTFLSYSKSRPSVHCIGSFFQTYLKSNHLE